MTIFTVGYEGTTIDAFIAALKTRRISQLIDVREMPLSRKRGFSKSALALALEAQGIRYLHMRALGCPKPIRDSYRLDSDWKRYTRAFVAYLSLQVDALAELRGKVKSRRTALMCFEADAERCHRSIVANAIAGPALGLVEHVLVADDSIEASAAVA